jgi:hypothetical protein
MSPARVVVAQQAPDRDFSRDGVGPHAPSRLRCALLTRTCERQERATIISTGQSDPLPSIPADLKVPSNQQMTPCPQVDLKR